MLRLSEQLSLCWTNHDVLLRSSARKTGTAHAQTFITVADSWSLLWEEHLDIIVGRIIRVHLWGAKQLILNLSKVNLNPLIAYNGRGHHYRVIKLSDGCDLGREQGWIQNPYNAGFIFIEMYDCVDRLDSIALCFDKCDELVDVWAIIFGTFRELPQLCRYVSSA